MKKIMALMLALLMIFSVPVLAGNEGGNSGKDIKAEGSTFKIRAAGGAAQRVAQATAKKAEVKTRLQAKKTEASQLRNRLLECKGDNAENCKQLRKESKVQAKNQIASAARRAVQFLEKAKKSIQKSKLSDEEKQASLAVIDGEISNLNEAGSEIEGQTEIKDKDQLKEVVGKMKKSWKHAKEKVSLKLHKAQLQRFGNVFKKTDLLDKKLKRMISNLERKGVDTSSVDVREFTSKLGEAKAAFEEANKFFEEAKAESSENAKGLLAQAREQMKASHRLLQESKNSLNSVLKNLRQTRVRAQEQGIDLEETEETETEDEDETEEDETAETETDETDNLNTEETQE